MISRVSDTKKLTIPMIISHSMILDDNRITNAKLSLYIVFDFNKCLLMAPISRKLVKNLLVQYTY